MASTQEEKEELIWDYFNKLLGSTQPRRRTLNLAAFHLAGEDLAHLDAPISESEVWEIIKNLPMDKAPGPDGFTGRFYKTCWATIKLDLMAAIGTLHSGDSRKLHLLNSAYMVLIPKKEEALQVVDYRPISLIHSFAKLVTKILANRLAGRLSSIVAVNQSAFIKGRRMHDNFMLVQ